MCEDTTWQIDAGHGEAGDLPEGTEDDLLELRPSTTQRIVLAGGHRQVELHLEGIEPVEALALALRAWQELGPVEKEPMGFGGEALITQLGPEE